jgi:hypothetical protein
MQRLGHHRGGEPAVGCAPLAVAWSLYSSAAAVVQTWAISCTRAVSRQPLHRGLVAGAEAEGTQPKKCSAR